jgi:hypothetical protein
MGKRIVSMLTAVALGVGWLFFLAHLTNGQGLVSIDFSEVVLNWIVVAVLSCGAFVFNAQLGCFALLGWAGGQFAFLTYDGMPKGRSPQMFQPTNCYEAALVGALIVVWFNWPLIVGAIGGFFMGREIRTYPKTSLSRRREQVRLMKP